MMEKKHNLNFYKKPFSEFIYLFIFVNVETDPRLRF